MARLSVISVSLILVWIILAQASEARKPVRTDNKGEEPRPVPPSHSAGNGERIMSEKLDGRSLESVPSPGAGH